MYVKLGANFPWQAITALYISGQRFYSSKGFSSRLNKILGINYNSCDPK